MCRYLSTASADCIGAFTRPSVGVHEHTVCYTCSEARKPNKSQCGQTMANTKVSYTTLSCLRCFPPTPEDEPSVGNDDGDGSGSATVNGNAISNGTVAVNGNCTDKGAPIVDGNATGTSNGNATNKGPLTVNGDGTNKGKFTTNGYATGTSNGTSSSTPTNNAPTVPSMSWIKEQGRELAMVKEAAMSRDPTLAREAPVMREAMLRWQGKPQS